MLGRHRSWDTIRASLSKRHLPARAAAPGPLSSGLKPGLLFSSLCQLVPSQTGARGSLPGRTTSPSRPRGPCLTRFRCPQVSVQPPVRPDSGSRKPRTGLPGELHLPEGSADFHLTSGANRKRPWQPLTLGPPPSRRVDRSPRRNTSPGRLGGFPPNFRYVSRQRHPK